MKSLVAGLFNSKILFGIPLVGSCWTKKAYRYSRTHKTTSTTKEDVVVLQRFQNRAMMLLVEDSGGDLSTQS